VLPQALATSTAVFAFLALTLAAVGIYGVVSYLVSQQTQDIGVRMALGATTRDIMWMVIGQGLRPVLAGMTAGILGAAAISSLLHAALLIDPAAPDLTSGVGAFDPATYVGLSLAVTAIAAFASYIPARRASSVDPLVALRHE
jgi:putative ABC transport system permease protein